MLVCDSQAIPYPPYTAITHYHEAVGFHLLLLIEELAFETFEEPFAGFSKEATFDEVIDDT
jgi:hypothetical protein